MSISEFAKVTTKEDKVVGMHWFNPPTRMKLVEVIKGDKTSEETMKVMWDFTEKLGKVPVRVEKDVPGFIVNRITAPSGALFGAILDQKVAEPEEVDATLMQVGQPMGAYVLFDYVGLDILSHGQEYCAKVISPDYEPPKFLKDLVDKGDLGMKTGKGIYDWSAGRPQIDMSKATDKVDATDAVAVQINEGVKLLEQGAVKSPDDIDTAMKYGMNVPVGPFEMLGMFDDLKGRLEDLAKKYNKEIFAPTRRSKRESSKNSWRVSRSKRNKRGVVEWQKKNLKISR
jgi:3-hydroxyacyl-CoA dehydrogenase